MGHYLASRNPGPELTVGVRPASRLRRPAAARPAERPAARRALLVSVPFFARGGVEATLYETLRHLLDRYEPIFLSLAPHSPELGDRRADFEELGHRLFSLGDWLHPAAMPEVIEQLIETYQPFAWYNANGTTLFYELAPRLKARFPQLRIARPPLRPPGRLHRVVQEGVAGRDRRLRGRKRHHRRHLGARLRLAERAGAGGLGLWPARRGLAAGGRLAGAAGGQTPRAGACRTEAKVILVAARMHEQKRPLDLPLLAARVKDLPVHFLIVGGGPLEAEVDAAIAEAARTARGSRRLPFRTDIPELILAADAGCLVSDYEGLPIFLLECLQAGRPFLGTDVGALGDVLRETGAGWVVDKPGDLAALEQAVRRLCDPEAYGRCREAAAARPAAASGSALAPNGTSRSSREQRRSRPSGEAAACSGAAGSRLLGEKPRLAPPAARAGSAVWRGGGSAGGGRSRSSRGRWSGRRCLGRRLFRLGRSEVARQDRRGDDPGGGGRGSRPGRGRLGRAERGARPAAGRDLRRRRRRRLAGAPRRPAGGSTGLARQGAASARRSRHSESRRVGPFSASQGAYRFPLLGAPAGSAWPTACGPISCLPAMPEIAGPPHRAFPASLPGDRRRRTPAFRSDRQPGRTCRALIVTLEPHRRAWARPWARARELTPHVFTLGDWLPRETHFGVLLHLLRVYRVETLVSWNGTIFFYDPVAAIRREFPRLRILAQLFHHQSGFFARTGPAGPGGDRRPPGGQPGDRRRAGKGPARPAAVPTVYLLHHGVALPAEPDRPPNEPRAAASCGADLGLPGGRPGGRLVRAPPPPEAAAGHRRPGAAFHRPRRALPAGRRRTAGKRDRRRSGRPAAAQPGPPAAPRRRPRLLRRRRPLPPDLGLRRPAGLPARRPGPRHPLRGHRGRRGARAARRRRRRPGAAVGDLDGARSCDRGPPRPTSPNGRRPARPPARARQIFFGGLRRRVPECPF